jgi:hypothetical protein
MNTQNLNLAKSTNYKLVIGSLPGVTLWLKTAMLPTISVNEIPIPDPRLGNRYVQSSTAVWAPLMVTFLVDEDLSNYNEVLEWMYRAGGPDETKRTYDPGLLYSTVSLHILTNNKNASDIVYTFHNAFPTILGELQFNNENAEELLTDITLQFDYMSLDKVI